MTSTTRTVSSHFNMIELYTWSTPNGRKVSIMLEECGLPYRVHKIDIGKGDQFTPEYVAINPNSKIPSIVDPEGPDGKPLALMESGAILVYLAGKTGKFLPRTPRGKYDALQWLMFQMGGVGPTFGQAHHFMRAKKDEMIYPWVARHEWHRVDLSDYPSVKRWYEGIGARPAVARGMAMPPLN